MGKILLYYPSFSRDEKDKTLYTDLPLSVITLAAQLHNKYDTEIIDARIDHLVEYELIKKLQDVFLVGVSATTSYQIVNGLHFAGLVRRHFPQIRIVWGGWHPSLMPEETIQHELVDVVIVGQGERIIGRLADCIRRNGDLQSVPNIYYKDNTGKIHRSPQIAFHNLQMPENIVKGYQYVNIERYIHRGWGNRRILGYESSRGCAYSCRFCSISAVFQRKWYGLPAFCVCHDILWLKKSHGIDAVHFFDNNFFVEKDRAKKIAGLFLENDINIRWDGTVVVSQFLHFSRREIDLLKQSGFYRVIVGVESGDEEVLTKINKRHTNQQILELVRRCREYDIMPSLSFMVGFPWHPEQDTENTIRLIEEVKQVNENTEVLLFVFSPYLGTPLYDTAKEFGMQFPDSLEGWADFTYDRANTPWVSSRLNRKLQRYLRFFGTKELGENERGFYSGFE